MKYRSYGKHKDVKVSQLAFGCMRLPMLESGEINETEAINLIRHAIDNGVNYIDTAYPYHNGKSELLVNKALKDGYREKVYLADKSPVWLVEKYEDFDRLLDEQLKKLGTDHIDFYLMHGLNKGSWDKVKSLNGLKFLDEAKKDGRIKFACFSFHDKLDTFKEIVDAYDWDGCQIQYNYMDIHNQAGIEGLHYAAKKGMAVSIMEPLLGGKLAKEPPESIKKLWETADHKRKPAEWGISWLLNQPEVTVVLSGMNSMQQVEENVRTSGMVEVNSLSEKEKELIDKVRDEYNRLTKVGCTGCRYCMPCPKGVKIPEIFSLYNQSAMYNDSNYCNKTYDNFEPKSKATSCVECGKCEKACPQHLHIRQTLKDAHKYLTNV